MFVVNVLTLGSLDLLNFLEEVNFSLFATLDLEDRVRVHGTFGHGADQLQQSVFRSL
jgi:hypothetical protein